MRREPNVTAWGSGLPRREFLYSDDLADACVFLMSLADNEFDRLLAADYPLVNIGCGEDLTIRELANQVQATVSFDGAVAWDTRQPDGTLRKLLDVSRLAGLGWNAKTSLPEGLALAYRDFLSRTPGA